MIGHKDLQLVLLMLCYKDLLHFRDLCKNATSEEDSTDIVPWWVSPDWCETYKYTFTRSYGRAYRILFKKRCLITSCTLKIWILFFRTVMNTRGMREKRINHFLVNVLLLNFNL
jgi:hypothetical protein